MTCELRVTLALKIHVDPARGFGRSTLLPAVTGTATGRRQSFPHARRPPTLWRPLCHCPLALNFYFCISLHSLKTRVYLKEQYIYSLQ